MIEIHPFVALMRTYCVDYTNSHDLSVCDSIMAHDYTLHMGEHHLRGRDEFYKPAVLAQFRQFPTLGLVVHDIVTNGDRLAMCFSEHGASDRHEGNLAAWSGIGVYRWNGTVLTENWVEQDYFSRQHQLDSGVPAPLDPPALDPWVIRAERENAATDTAIRLWLLEADHTGTVIDERSGTSGPQPRFEIESVVVDDIFTAGPKAAFHVTFAGVYLGGLDGCEAAIGTSASHSVAGIVEIADGHVVGRLITDRLGLWKRLQAGLESGGS